MIAIRNILGPDDDWWETLRNTVYPRLHRPLTRLGNAIGIPLFATGEASPQAYVGRLRAPVELVEIDLATVGFTRNPLSCYKHTSDGRTGIGSWVLRSHNDPLGYIERDMQLHVTLFPVRGNENVCDLYGHYETDWQDDPLGHLRGEGYSASYGVSLMWDYIMKCTDLTFVDRGNHNYEKQ